MPNVQWSAISDSLLSVRTALDIHWKLGIGYWVFGMSYPLLRSFGGGIPKDVLAIVPEIVARRYEVMPFARTEAGVKAAMVQPNDAAMRHWIAKRAGVPVLPHAVTQDVLMGALRQYDTTARDAFAEAPAERFDALLDAAHEYGAADVHSTPTRDGAMVRMRVDGLLLDVAEVARDVHDTLLAVAERYARRRDAMHPIGITRTLTRFGERMVVRLLGASARRHTLQTLGLSPEHLAAVRRMIASPHGMLLVAGPPGSGRTTTLYAMLRLLRHAGRRIVAVEDPIAHAMSGVEQVEAPSERFADAVRLMFRSAPDIVMVGDVRDAEVARMAFDAAMGGRLVCAGMDAADTTDAQQRLRSFGIPQPFITSALRGIIAQRLARTPCTACGISRTGDRGRGCDRCQRTGYGGRRGIFEIGEGAHVTRVSMMRV